jgi:hypothetical protein
LPENIGQEELRATIRMNWRRQQAAVPVPQGIIGVKM